MKIAKRRLNVSERVAACMLAVAISAPASAAMEEGNWEVTMRMEVAGMPFAMPPMKQNQCVTKKDLVPDMSQSDQNCLVKDQKVVGDTVSWRIQCKGKDGTMDGEGKIKYASKRYDGEMRAKMTDPGGQAMEVQYTMQGIHTGACKADSKKAKKA